MCSCYFRLPAILPGKMCHAQYSGVSWPAWLDVQLWVGKIQNCCKYRGVQIFIYPPSHSIFIYYLLSFLTYGISKQSSPELLIISKRSWNPFWPFWCRKARNSPFIRPRLQDSGPRTLTGVWGGKIGGEFAVWLHRHSDRAERNRSSIHHKYDFVRS